MGTSVSGPVFVSVSTQSELEDAYRVLTENSGGTILLAAGPAYHLYGNDWAHLATDAPVTIRSSTPGDPATLRFVDLRGRENLTIEQVIFAAAPEDYEAYQHMLELTEVQDITIRDSVLMSTADGPRGTTLNVTNGVGMGVVRASEGVVFSDNQAVGFDHGLTLRDTYDTTIIGNTFSGFQGDGLRLAGATGVLIQGNNFHDFYGSTWAANHPDMIQLWGTGIQVNNANITIRENVFDTGEGVAYQMIFGHNEDAEHNGYLFENILIEHNVLFGAHQHMISLSDTANAVVRHNTVIPNPHAYFVNADGTQTLSGHRGFIQIEGEGAVVEYNIAPGIAGGVNNTTLATRDDFAGHFTNIEAGGSGDLRDLQLRPDSPLNGVMGSHLSWSASGVADLRAVVDVEMHPTDRSVVTLDARLSQGPTGYLTNDETQFLWHFSDGHTASGAVVVHDFETPGRHEYTLQVVAADGTTDQITRSVDIVQNVLVALPFGAAPSEVGASYIDATSAPLTDSGFTIGGDAHLTVSRTFDDLFQLHSFDFALGVERADNADGFLLYLHNSLHAKIDVAGHVTFVMTTAEGRFEVTSDTAVFADNRPHLLNFVYDGAAEHLMIYADGLRVGLAEASGPTASRVYWGLTIGHDWGKSIAADISYVRLSREPTSADEISELASALGFGGADAALTITANPEPPVPVWEDGVLFDPDKTISDILGLADQLPDGPSLKACMPVTLDLAAYGDHTGAPPENMDAYWDTQSFLF